MSLLRRIFGGRGEFIASRRPSGYIVVEDVLERDGAEALEGRVRGIVYPGYKVKGRNVAVIRELRMGGRSVDFAVDGDSVTVVLEGRARARKGETLEVYPS